MQVKPEVETERLPQPDRAELRLKALCRQVWRCYARLVGEKFRTPYEHELFGQLQGTRVGENPDKIRMLLRGLGREGRALPLLTAQMLSETIAVLRQRLGTDAPVSVRAVSRALYEWHGAAVSPAALWEEVAQPAQGGAASAGLWLEEAGKANHSNDAIRSALEGAYIHVTRRLRSDNISRRPTRGEVLLHMFAHGVIVGEGKFREQVVETARLRGTELIFYPSNAAESRDAVEMSYLPLRKELGRAPTFRELAERAQADFAVDVTVDQLVCSLNRQRVQAGMLRLEASRPAPASDLDCAVLRGAYETARRAAAPRLPSLVEVSAEYYTLRPTPRFHPDYLKRMLLHMAKHGCECQLRHGQAPAELLDAIVKKTEDYLGCRPLPLEIAHSLTLHYPEIRMGRSSVRLALRDRLKVDTAPRAGARRSRSCMILDPLEFVVNDCDEPTFEGFRFTSAQVRRNMTFELAAERADVAQCMGSAMALFASRADEVRSALPLLEALVLSTGAGGDYRFPGSGLRVLGCYLERGLLPRIVVSDATRAKMERVLAALNAGCAAGQPGDPRFYLQPLLAQWVLKNVRQGNGEPTHWPATVLGVLERMLLLLNYLRDEALASESRPSRQTTAGEAHTIVLQNRG